MKFERREPPREFEVGLGETIRIRDCGRIELDPDEQVTFVTESGSEYDVARKDWGFYATPSLNARLVESGLRPVLVKNRRDRYFLLLVERGKEPQFERYLDVESLVVVRWLDTVAGLEHLA